MLGFQKEQMLILDFEGDEKVQQNIEVIKKAIADQPGVNAVAASRAVPRRILAQCRYAYTNTRW